MSKKTALVVLMVGAVAATIGVLRFSLRSTPPPVLPDSTTPVLVSTQTTPPPASNMNTERLKKQMLAQLASGEPKGRALDLPSAPELLDETIQTPPAPQLSAVEIARIEGRKKRAGLPMGVVLWDKVLVHSDPGGRNRLFEMMTGDFVRVFPDEKNGYVRVQPGLDIYLIATTKAVEPAGERLPDRDGWVKKSDVHIFDPDQAKEFLNDQAPVTLGNDTSFSTLDFYDRAMKNPDPVVHRVIGPRMIVLVLLHEDYSSSWSALYRDKDPKIRDAALAALRDRGVGHSRPILDDLVGRLAELTKTRAQGEAELEVLAILGILKDSKHPSIKLQLPSFVEAWHDTQSPKINEALADILK